MQVYIRPFQVTDGTQQTLVVTAASQTLTLPTPAVGTKSVRLVVSGTSTIFWKYGATVTTTNGTAMLAGTVETFLLPNDVTQISFIGATTGSTVYLVVGESA